jgi:hypothetical protein
MKMLELFKGTGSIGKVAEKLGFNIISLDFDKKFKPDILTDILNWDYKKYKEDNNYIPDYIWASPPCNSYCVLAYTRKERNTKTAEPYSERAKLGTNILYKTLEIIDYFKNLNPNLKYCIENPHAMMRHDEKMKQLNKYETMYGLYGDNKVKHTDFWANYELKLKEPKRKNILHQVFNTAKLPLLQRYAIPEKLVENILNNYLEYKSIVF